MFVKWDITDVVYRCNREGWYVLYALCILYVFYTLHVLCVLVEIPQMFITSLSRFQNAVDKQRRILLPSLLTRSITCESDGVTRNLSSTERKIPWFTIVTYKQASQDYGASLVPFSTSKAIWCVTNQHDFQHLLYLAVIFEAVFSTNSLKSQWQFKLKNTKTIWFVSVCAYCSCPGGQVHPPKTSSSSSATLRIRRSFPGAAMT